jgi:hypothetical protein
MKALILAAFVITTIQSLAQDNWKRGKVVLTSGDTLDGEILYEDWKQSPQQIVYRSAAGGAERSVLPLEAKSFVINNPNELYEPFTAEITYYLLVPVAQGVSPIDKKVEVTAFFEVLLSNPKVSLYRFIDDQNTPRFFIKRENVLRELHNISYYTKVNEGVVHVERPNYREELKQILNDCGKPGNKKVFYTAASLVDAVREYLNGCHQTDNSSFEQANLKPQINVGGFYGGFIIGSTGAFGGTAEIISGKRFQRFSTIFELGKLTDTRNIPESLKFPPTYFSIFGCARLLPPAEAPVSPALLFGFSSMHVVNAGFGFVHKNGSGLTIHHTLLSGGVPFKTPVTSLQLRIMFNVRKK